MKRFEGMFTFVKRQMISFSAVILVAFPLLSPALKASAQSNGLGITPKLSYTINPGSQRTDTLYINNLSTSQPLNLKLTMVDFKPLDESGAPSLLQSPNAPQTPWSLKPFITMPDFVTIDAGKSKLVPFTIKIPASVGAGSYYSAVEYSAITGADGHKVNIAASSATLIFVTVPGNAKEQLTMVQFGTEQKNKFQSIFTKAPQEFAYRVKNAGNLTESPAGSIVIKNIFGHVVAHIDNANPLSQLVLIGQTRKLEVCNPKSTKQEDLGRNSNCHPLNISPGMYTADVELFYGLNGHASHQIGAKSVFWYLPLWFIIVVILALLVIAYAIYYIYRRISSPHRHHKHR